MAETLPGGLDFVVRFDRDAISHNLCRVFGEEKVALYNFGRIHGEVDNPWAATLRGHALPPKSITPQWTIKSLFLQQAGRELAVIAAMCSIEGLPPVNCCIDSSILFQATTSAETSRRPIEVGVKPATILLLRLVKPLEPFKMVDGGTEIQATISVFDLPHREVGTLIYRGVLYHISKRKESSGRLV